MLELRERPRRVRAEGAAEAPADQLVAPLRLGVPVEAQELLEEVALAAIVEGLELGEALERLERAAYLLGTQADAKDRTWLLVLKAQAALDTEEVADAEQLARQAIDAAVADDPQLRGSAETVLGRAAAARDDLDGAIAAFERAEALLSSGDRRHLVELLEHWSAVLERAGRLEEALAVVRRASRVASQRGRREPAPSRVP